MPVAERRADEWLLRMLTTRGLLDDRTAQAMRESPGRHASTELLRSGRVTQEQLTRAVLEQYGVEFDAPEFGALEKLALGLVPERLCRQHLMIPLRIHEDAIEMLMTNPIDTGALDTVAALTGRRPRPFFGLPENVEALIAKAYDSDAVIFDLLNRFPETAAVECLGPDGNGESYEASSAAIGAPVIRLVNLIVGQAIHLKASDIHVEHDEKATTIRCRIDGVLRQLMTLPRYIGEGPLVSRIKIMADLDISNRRRPQDGRAKLRVGIEEVGLRVSTMPTAFGEKAVLRILDRRQAEVPLEELGFRPEIKEALTRLGGSSKGLLLVTGPTGSGKTTTLYSMLNRLKSEDLNIVTIEDPIEYRVPGLNQIQVNEKAGLNFAAVLRSVLRQDPDVVLVGEIRDLETADVALQTAQTGHLVFSTLHTNDALATLNRLLDMGVDRYKITAALIGIAGQRLVRRICPACREEVPVDARLADFLMRSELPVRRFQGRGCSKCGLSGFAGRIALTELLALDRPEAHDALMAMRVLADFRAEAVRRGWLKTMEEDALWHLSQGNAPLEEILPCLDFKEREERAVCRPAARKPRVLIVDDNEDNRAVARATLLVDELDIVEAEGGRQAVKEIARRKPDLVLLDLMMPEMDGLAVVRHLRGEMGLGDLPIMVLTALGEAESQARALELGADDYLSKPFNPQVLRARVKALFRRSAFAKAGSALRESDLSGS
ncbi:MAG: Flp pilus assembly complex ATPase component TadA [Elusimicrobia bacterium]|nr:Flp pilus assembly complex ATPase component TadA [Elusimicrobiota bacterium]